MTNKWQTPALVVEYLDTAYPQALTVATLVTYTGSSETTVRKALKELVLDGEVIKDGTAYRRPLHETGSNAIGPDATFFDPSPAEMDSTMREQISSPVTDHDVQHDMDEHVVVEGLSAMLETRDAHTTLLDALRTAGHDVDEWADDPTMLQDYAEAVKFHVETSQNAETPVEPEAGTSDQPADAEASDDDEELDDDFLVEDMDGAPYPEEWQERLRAEYRKSGPEAAVELAKKIAVESTTGKKRYSPRRDNPDRPVRVNQKTGSKLQVVPRVDFEDWSSRRDGTTVRIGEDIVTFPWYTICHTHSTFVGAKKIMAAWAYSTNPESFCHGCKEVTDAGR